MSITIGGRKMTQSCWVTLVTFFLSYGTLLAVWSQTQSADYLSNQVSYSDNHKFNKVIQNSPVYRRLSDSISDVDSYQERAPRSVLDYSQSEQLIGDSINNEDNSISSTPSPSISLPPTTMIITTEDRLTASKPNKLLLIKKSVNNVSKRKWQKYEKTKLKDIFISVKTTHSYHRTRLDIILKTWYNQARDETYFFTDKPDDEYNHRTNGHLIVTNCSASHHRQALCCKMAAEFDTFLASNKKWFCHFDDDNYVNVPSLVKHLQKYSPNQPWYLGKPSIRAPLEILDRDGQQKKISFWFATGGAGFCISRALAFKMKPIASKGKFTLIGDKIRLPDDVTIGYIIEHMLGVKLKVIPEFHSHLEPMKFIKQESLANQITFSYSRFGDEMNVVTVNSTIDSKTDPTRFISLYCHLNGC